MTNADTSYESPGSWYYLWHLISLGVIEATFNPLPTGGLDLGSPTITDTVWDKLKAAQPTSSEHSAKVALIDVGVSRTHPNLKDRIDGNHSIDLVTHRYGAQSAPSGGASPHAPEANKAFFGGLDITGLDTLDLNGLDAATPGAKVWLDALVKELKTSQGVVRTLIDTDETFGSHGTSIAGLVVGAPELVTPPAGGSPATPHPGGSPATTSNLLGGASTVCPSTSIGVIPYFGVDPLSDLISIRSSFRPDPAHFVAAFLYAWQCGADVILLPRGLPDISATRSLKHKVEPDDADELARFQKSPERANLLGRLEQPLANELAPNAVAPVAQPDLGWDVLEALLVAISKKIPIVCAAGNDGESQLIYPANLARPDNGIIAVGAVTSKGYRSGYSNYGEHLTLVAPSDDGEVYNRHQLRVDRTNPMVGLHAYVADEKNAVPYSPLSLLTTDLLGTFGYAEGSNPLASIFPPLPGAKEGIGGYYAPFGGTSGASALIAGIAALVARAHKAKHGSKDARLGGKEMKDKLVIACHLDRPVLADGAPPTPDTMNADNEPADHDKKYFFGAGLPNAWEAVNAALT